MPTDRIQRFFIVTRGFTPAELPGAEESLFEGDFLDSLATIEFVAFLEQEFGVTLTIEDGRARELRIDQCRGGPDTQKDGAGLKTHWTMSPGARDPDVRLAGASR